ncbi:MAG: 5-oxoprolinase subunit B family protein [Acidimicrobiales bacterium]
MRVLPAGPHALLVEVADQASALGLYAEIRRRVEEGWPGPPPVEVVPAARTVLLDGLEQPSRVAAEIESWPALPGSVPVGDLVECPTVYDGPDLELVARHWGMSPREVVGIHTSTEFCVAFCGFAPGFAYLVGLPPTLAAVPRRPSPRPEVPAGTVALAGEHSAIYPRASPGGWQLIGRTELVLWDPARQPPALLSPGARARFVEVAT